MTPEYLDALLHAVFLTLVTVLVLDGLFRLTSFLLRSVFWTLLVLLLIFTAFYRV
jgi:hypothetical protein